MKEESILPAIRLEAQKYVNNNFVNPTEADFLIIYNAMLKATYICILEESERLSETLKIKNMIKEEISKGKP